MANNLFDKYFNDAKNFAREVALKMANRAHIEIAQVQKENAINVNEAKDRISTIEKRYIALESRYDDLKQKLDAIKVRLAPLEKLDAKSITDRLDNLQHMLFGDSGVEELQFDTTAKTHSTSDETSFDDELEHIFTTPVDELSSLSTKTTELDTDTSSEAELKGSDVTTNQFESTAQIDVSAQTQSTPSLETTPPSEDVNHGVGPGEEELKPVDSQEAASEVVSEFEKMLDRLNKKPVGHDFQIFTDFESEQGYFYIRCPNGNRINIYDGGAYQLLGLYLDKCYED